MLIVATLLCGAGVGGHDTRRPAAASHGLCARLRLRGGSGPPYGFQQQFMQEQLQQQNFEQQQIQQQQQQHQQFQMQQPPPTMPADSPTGGPQGFPGFENGFVDNGVPYSEQFAEQLRQRRMMGHDIPLPTPEMFQGMEGVSFDAKGNFQLGESPVLVHECRRCVF